MTGTELIAEERRQQIEKHGFNEAHDDAENTGELKRAAIYLLGGGTRYFPFHWSQDWKSKFDRKSKIQKLTIAGALIAAEIDRIQRDS